MNMCGLHEPVAVSCMRRTPFLAKSSRLRTSTSSSAPPPDDVDVSPPLPAVVFIDTADLLMEEFSALVGFLTTQRSKVGDSTTPSTTTTTLTWVASG